MSRQFKTVFLGNSGVGKSCILKRIVQNEYDGKMEPTIGGTFLSKTINIDGESITFQLWDTAGQENFRSLTKIYFKCTLQKLVYIGQESHIAILVYDVTKKGSFESLMRWYLDLSENCDRNSFVLALCGNKIDLDNDVVSYTEAKKLAEKIEAELFLVSAKTGQGIEGNV